MSSALNTNVNGSSGTCRAAADGLGRLAGASRRVGDATTEARTRAESGWSGPAADKFSQACQHPSLTADRLDDGSTKAERALRTFADQLDTVSEKMAEARSIAAAGGLRIEGPFIIKPQEPMPPARLTGATNPSQSSEVLARNRAAYEAHNDAVAEYNAQATAYNKAKRLVEDARGLEEQAHHDLTESMRTTTADINAGALVYGFTTKAAAYTAIAENGRVAQLESAERFGKTADIFTRAATGQIATLTPAQTKIMQDVAEKAGANRDQALKRATQFEKFVSAIPQKARDYVAAHPGRGNPGYEKSGRRAFPAPTAAGRVLKSLPYVGSTLVAFNEARGAMSGEQSWGKAAADFGAQTGGAAVGATTGAWAGSVAGPPGMLIGGVLGGILGGMAGQDVVDFATGEDNGIG